MLATRKKDRREPKMSGTSAGKGIGQKEGAQGEAAKESQGRARRKLLTPEEYADGILRGDRVILAQAITLVESTLPAHMALALGVIEKCLPYTGNSIRIGVTGIPGVGKSTFIDAFGSYLTETEGKRVAVLAVDPTSRLTGGSILADKTRMKRLAARADAFIRPSPSGTSLGGVARRTREAILLCEAAGFDAIIVETVGVGQSETAVRSMVDFFLLLMIAGAGDELQGIKRGIMEMVDAIAITKADGANREKAELARKEFESALRLFPPTDTGWTPQVLTCSALEGRGIKEVWDMVLRHHETLEKRGALARIRSEQLASWMHDTIRERLEEGFYTDEGVRESLPKVESDVVAGKISPFAGAMRLLDIYFKKLNPEGAL